ncbi:spore germination protein GerPE [Halalkalibacter alkaliphilus]|uniref:spore germination protein GerPE n=1 Tax=Halalkalibacter alkaliphilus TaxID=2917993 RepID=UPI0023DE973B|nr:spore germination protein GerPE [Halalkalibacter alkaliphilus]
MLKRTSIVHNIKVINVGLSSIFEIGDSLSISPRSKAWALQRQFELFYGNEGHFRDPVFTRPLPKPDFDEHVCFVRYNESPTIKVNNIFVTAAAASSVLHIGSTQLIDSESRVKHIRQLLHGQEANDE